MTEQALKRGQEIEHETRQLRLSLGELLNNRIFRVSNSDMCGQLADPFLADLEVKTRSFATNAINQRIQDLNSEFKDL